MSLTLKQEEIKSILAEVKASIQAAKKADAEKLSKAVEESSSPATSEASAESAPMPPEASDSSPVSAPEASGSSEASSGESSPDSSHSGESSHSGDSSPGDGAPPMAAEAAPEGHPEGHEDPAMDEHVDPAALCAEYEKLGDEALKSHYMACKQAVFNRMQAAQPADPSAPPAPGMDAMKGEASAGEGTAPKGNVDPVTPDKKDGLTKVGMSPEAVKAMAKPGTSTEAGTASKGNVDPVTPTGSQNLNGPAAAKNGPGANLSPNQVPKSQPQLDNAIKPEVQKSEQVQNLEAQVAGLAKAVTLLLNGNGIRKAVTSIAMVDRAEGLNKAEQPKKVEMTPAEVKAKLTGLIRDGKLSKAERQAVIDYSFTKNQVHLEKLAHLFK